MGRDKYPHYLVVNTFGQEERWFPVGDECEAFPSLEDALDLAIDAIHGHRNPYIRVFKLDPAQEINPWRPGEPVPNRVVYCYPVRCDHCDTPADGAQEQIYFSHDGFSWVCHSCLTQENRSTQDTSPVKAGEYNERSTPPAPCQMG